MKKMDLTETSQGITLSFWATRTEADIESTFLEKGGTLGDAAARAQSHFSLTGSEKAVSVLVTDKPTRVDIPVPEACLGTRDLETGAVRLKSRAHLHISGFRLAAAINGTVVDTLTGQASVPIMDLFIHKLYKTEDSGTPVVEMPFRQVALKYPNWAQNQAVAAIAAPKITAADATGAPEEQTVQIMIDQKLDAEMKKVEPIIQATYDSSWAKRKKLVYEGSPRLTKSVMAVPFGLNASGYNLAAAVNDTPPPATDAVLEKIMAECIGLEYDYDREEIDKMLVALETPSIAATTLYAEDIASGLSTFAAFHMPYRVDGVSVTLPTGVKMIASESWRAEASGEMAADDCDGSACNIVSVIRRGVANSESKMYPFLRAIGNSIGAHFVYGVSVLGANAGHAAQANEKTKQVAGHAVAIAIPKVQFQAGVARGVVGSVAGEPVAAAADHKEIIAATFEALYPEDLVARMPEKERSFFSDHETMVESALADPVKGPQALAMEGTTPTHARMYTHDRTKRHERRDAAEADAVVSKRLAPNITRSVKMLDATRAEKHKFYQAFVELSQSMTSPLFTSEKLREKGYASPHSILVPLADDGNFTKAGASPEELCTGKFAVVPLWTMGHDAASTIDAPLEEARINTMPATMRALELMPTEVAGLGVSKKLLSELHVAVADKPATENSATTYHVLSYATLVRNPAAVQAFCKTALAVPAISGSVRLEPVPGLADADGEEAGFFAVVTLNVPERS